eukprot:438033-Prymnesium_polylepis.1
MLVGCGSEGATGRAEEHARGRSPAAGAQAWPEAMPVHPLGRFSLAAGAQTTSATSATWRTR